MSFVGPRPDLPIQVATYTDIQKNRLAVKPGLTGIAQISGNTRIGWDERINLDLWYIEHWSFWLDIKILLLTPFAVINGACI
jgi:lipopolysaccharide/colanic/teichoic acid biosynthesis glycosyltransferase